MDGGSDRGAALRRRIVEIVETHLDEIVEETMRAYLREIPAVASAPPATLGAMREATARTTRAFLRTYADPGSPMREQLDRARRATFERAGETFARGDIAEVIRVGRLAVYAASRRFIERDLVVGEQDRKELQEQLDAFLDDLARSENVVHLSPDVLGDWLRRAEQEGPDVR